MIWLRDAHDFVAGAGREALEDVVVDFVAQRVAGAVGHDEHRDAGVVAPVVIVVIPIRLTIGEPELGAQKIVAVAIRISQIAATAVWPAVIQIVGHAAFAHEQRFGSSIRDSGKTRGAGAEQNSVAAVEGGSLVAKIVRASVMPVAGIVEPNAAAVGIVGADFEGLHMISGVLVRRERVSGLKTVAGIVVVDELINVLGFHERQEMRLKAPPGWVIFDCGGRPIFPTGNALFAL